MTGEGKKIMHFDRQGKGTPLLLIHGLGSSWRSWSPVLDSLAEQREVIAIDLPGFGQTPALPVEVSISTLADAVTEFLHAEHLTGIDAVGSSMAARRVLELARRGDVLGHFHRRDAPQETIRLILANTGRSANFGFSREKPMRTVNAPTTTERTGRLGRPMPADGLDGIVPKRCDMRLICNIVESYDNAN